MSQNKQNHHQQVSEGEPSAKIHKHWTTGSTERGATLTTTLRSAADQI